MTFLFPLPYDNSLQHNESWERAKLFVGKHVKVVAFLGEIVVGVVEKCEVSSGHNRQGYGVGFMIRCGSQRYPYSVPVNAALLSIELI